MALTWTMGLVGLRYLAAAAFGLAIAACGGGAPQGSSGATGHTESAAGAPSEVGVGRCVDGRTQPLEKTTAIAVLRAHGFGVQESEFSPLCTSTDVMMDLTNIVLRGEAAMSREQRDEIGEREGHVLCSLRVRPIYGGGHVIRELERSEARVRLVIDNFQCALYPESAEQVRRLDAAFAELAALLSAQADDA